MEPAPALARRPIALRDGRLPDLLAHDIAALDEQCVRLSRALAAWPSGLSTRTLAGFEMRMAAAITPQQRARLAAATADPLAAHWQVAPRDLGVFASRPPAEFACMRILSRDRHLSLAHAELANAWCMLTGYRTPAAYRQEPVFSGADSDGRRVRFIEPEHVEARMSAVLHSFNSTRRATCAWDASWILVSTLNAHPFMRGNGRLARALFVSTLHRAGIIPAPVIPLGPLVYCTNGAFELAIRRVELDDDWRPFLKLLATLIGMCVDWMATPASPRAEPT